MPRDTTVEAFFPGLRSGGYTITSPETPDYNCIAWAAGDDSRFWWPASLGGYYWPVGVPRETTLTAFAEAFAQLGYEQCDDGGFQDDFEKVVIYVGQNGQPTHAARQNADGTWTSKLGTYVDISHRDPEGLCGFHYGSISMYLKRRRRDPS